MRKTPHDQYHYRAVVGAEVKRWNAFWLTTERFRKLPFRPLATLHGFPELATENKNIHTLYRKNITLLEREIESAQLFITGDDIYKLYLNGTFVGEGPAQSYPFAYHYNCYDVTDLLKAGEVNAIGVHVFYQGLHNIYLMSADNAEGVILQLEISYADGTSETICSDSTWVYKESTARTSRYTFGYQTALSEDIDLNLWEDGWYDVDHDLSDWKPVSLTGCPYPVRYELQPQSTPLVKHEIIHPKTIAPIENGFFLDFGRELVGTIALRIKGNPGDVIEIRCGEELLEDGRVRYDMRCNCRYQEYITLTGNDDFVDFFDFKGYRYVEILGITALECENVWTLHRNYPFPEQPASFASSDELMNRIWEMCFHGVRIGTQDTYYDCPTREKGGFVGDALITGQSHYLLTGDIRVFRKFITDFANSARHSCGLIPHVPTNSLGFGADYSLLYPLFLDKYYEYTGDLDFIREKLPVADGVLEYFRRYENQDGLLEHIQHPCGEQYEPFVLDWPQNYRDDYDFERARNGVCTTINGFYYGFLKTTAKLYDLIGDTEKTTQYMNRTQRVGESINALCYSKKTGLYLDTPQSEHSALHASVIPLYFGLEPPNGYGPIVDLLRRKRLNCGVYFAYFLIGLLYRIGESDLAYDLLSGTDEHSWANMLREGATSCMEAWGKEQKWNTSWCHPWSSSPIIFYTEEILGIRSNVPGLASIRISPKIPASLDCMKLELPVPDGRLFASFVRENGRISYTVRAPEQMEIIFDANGNDAIDFTRLS